MLRLTNMILAVWMPLWIAAWTSAAPPPSPAVVDHFEKKVRPLLAGKCWQCHGPEKQKGGLRLDSAAAVAKGGDFGPVVMPGNPDKSLLIQAVRQTGDLKMPPKDKLTDREIADLAAWIKDGAAWPGAPVQATATGKRFTQQQKAFWSFQPVKAGKLPVPKDKTWPSSPIDHFILAQLEAKGLTPAPKADKRTLIRRVTFDLIGLPPTPLEIDAFLADQSPDAFARVVDRLLASPHYGERWGRHWLDVVRYADSTANDANAVMRFAYRYRDYVVGAFNQDKPYDQFIIEQLAGDLLPSTNDVRQNAGRIIATGFLMIGPKALAETDKEQTRMDVVDDQIDVTGRAFLGLTVGCARCHDHKFDPIPTVDYYALAGIFRSTEVFQDENRNAAMWMEFPVALRSGERPELVMAPKEAKPRDLPVHIRGNRHNLGQTVPRHFPQIIAGEKQPVLAAKQSGRLELARWIASPANPLTARVMVNRIWQGHFGTGLVATSDNFGMRGEAPSHPELLDWLAARFVESGWSVKAMHRLILLSSTYQQSSSAERGAQSAPTPTSHSALRAPRFTDPENRLLWQMPRRRLEAEAIRDSLLAVSGRLDRTIGGGGREMESVITTAEALDPKRGFYVPRVKSDHECYNSSRRSIYLPVIRNAQPESLALFDAADANNVTALRNDTTVPTQAMFMLNNPLVREQALHFAKWLLADVKASDQDRVRSAYARALGRPPSADEMIDAMAFLKEYAREARKLSRTEADGRLTAWQSYCQMLFCSNEFLYVD